jgi:hypothetical protein
VTFFSAAHGDINKAVQMTDEGLAVVTVGAPPQEMIVDHQAAFSVRPRQGRRRSGDRSMRCVFLAAFLVLFITASGRAVHAAGAAIPYYGKYPIVFLADQTRDDIQERIRDRCLECQSAIAGVQTVRDTCLTTVMAKYKAGIGGENDLVACMEKKSGVFIQQARSKPQDDEADDNDGVPVDLGSSPSQGHDLIVSDTEDGEPDDVMERDGGTDRVMIVRGLANDQ